MFQFGTVMFMVPLPFLFPSSHTVCNIKTKVKKFQISLFIVLKNSSLLHFHSWKPYTLIPLHVHHHVAAMLLHKIHTTLL